MVEVRLTTKRLTSMTFSEFIRLASSRLKKKVYARVLKLASERQLSALQSTGTNAEGER